MKSLSKVFGWVSFNNAAALLTWSFNFFSAYLRAPIISVLLVFFPVVVAVIAPNLLVTIIIFVTILVVEFSLLCYFDLDVSSEGFLYVLFFVGISLGLDTLSLNMPSQITMIIAACFLVIGVVQIVFLDVFIAIEVSEKNEFNKYGHVFLFVVVLASVTMVVANFGSQIIWLPLTACVLLTYCYISGRIVRLQSNEKKMKRGVASLLVLVGIISSLIQFNEAKIFGILIWVIAIIILAIVIFIFLVTYLRKIIRKKTRERLESKNKENLEKTLTEKSPNLSAEEIISAFNIVRKDFGAQLLLNNDIINLELCITVCNQQRQIYWDNKLNSIIEVMKKAAEIVKNDGGIKKLSDIISNIRNVISSAKTDKDTCYEGEESLYRELLRIENSARHRR